MSAKNKKTEIQKKINFINALTGNIGKILILSPAIIAIITTVAWWKIDEKNKLMDSQLKIAEIKLKELDIELKNSGITESELKNAQLKPRFSVQYMIFGGAVYGAIKTGGLDLGSTEAFGVIRKNKDAKAAYESLYEFPLLETNLDKHLQSGKLNAFLQKYSHTPLKKRDQDALTSVSYTVLSLSCFGGTTAKDVELIYEERTVPNEPFMFPPEGLRYRDSPMQYAEGAPIQSEKLQYNYKQMILKLGDIEPGRGRIIPIQIALRPEGVYDKNGYYVDFVAISSYHLKPLRIRYKTLTGEMLDQPIREQLGIPMPMSDFIDIRG